MSDAILEVDRLSVSYGGVKAVREVTLSVAPGEVLGIIGPNGAGKSSLLDAISGFAPITQGELRFEGQGIRTLRPHQRTRRGIARTWQHVSLFDELTVAENVRMAVLAPVADAAERMTRRPAGRSTRRPRLSRGEGDRIAEEILARLNLTEIADRLPSELSHGQRMLVGIGRAMAAAPAVMLMDEPAAGLDAGERQGLAALIRSLADSGTAIIVIDHDMPLLLGFCDRICVLDFGRLIKTGTPDEVREDPGVIAAYLGTAEVQQTGLLEVVDEELEDDEVEA